MSNPDAAPSNEQWWSGMIKWAEDEDASYDPAKAWVPPIIGALSRAAYESPLRSLVPFTSLARLCISRRPWSHGYDVVAAHVEYGPSPPDGGRSLTSSFE